MDRKIRSDKKRDVKPTISNYVKETLYRFASLSEQPVKDAGLNLIKEGLQHDVILCEFQKIMITDYKLDNHFYFGNSEKHPSTIQYRGLTGKVTIKFPNDIYDELRRLAFAIGLTPTSTAAIMIRSTLYNPVFMDVHKNQFYERLSIERFRKLEKFVLDIKHTIPNKKRPPF